MESNRVRKSTASSNLAPTAILIMSKDIPEDKKAPQPETVAVFKMEDSLEAKKLRGAVSREKLQQTLKEAGLELVGEREPLSSGFFGPIYLVKARNVATGEIVSLVEKTFMYGVTSSAEEYGRRYRITDLEADDLVKVKNNNIRFRLGLVDQETGRVKEVVIDWLYNEEMALDGLAEIPGIPRNYGAAYEGVKGSILEQFIEGYDICFILDNVQSKEEINVIFDKILTTYKQAAAKGFIYNYPSGSTIMIEAATGQPYLIDWYRHCAGSIDSEGPIQDKYKEGIADIEEMRRIFLREWDLKEAEKIRSAI